MSSVIEEKDSIRSNQSSSVHEQYSYSNTCRTNNGESENVSNGITTKHRGIEGSREVVVDKYDVSLYCDRRNNLLLVGAIE